MTRWTSVEEVISAYRRAHDLYVEVGDAETALLVSAIKAEMIRKFVTEESVGRQLMEMAFLKANVGIDEVEPLSDDIAQRFSTIPFDKLNAFSNPPDFGSVPYDFLSAYFRSKRRIALAEQIDSFNVKVDDMAVVNWLSLHSPTLADTKDGLRRAKTLVRHAALKPHFRASFVRADGEVTNAGIVLALEPLDETLIARGLPGRTMPTVREDEYVESVDQHNHKLLFTAAWQVLSSPKNSHLDRNLLTPIINGALDYVLSGSLPKKYLDVDGRLVNEGETAAVKLALKELQSRGLEIEISTVVELSASQRAFAEDIVQVPTEKSAEVLFVMLDTGKIAFSEWAQMKRSEKAEFVSRVGAIIANYQSHSADYAKKWPFILLRVNLDLPDEKGNRARHDVNLHALQWAVDNARRTYAIDQILSDRYRNFSRLTFEGKWAKMIYVLMRLNNMSESKLYDREGQLKPRRVIDAYLYTQADVMLRGRYPQLSSLADDKYDELMSELIKILRRQNLENRITAYGDITPEVVFEAYDIMKSGKSRGAFDDEEATDEHEDLDLPLD